MEQLVNKNQALWLRDLDFNKKTHNGYFKSSKEYDWHKATPYYNGFKNNTKCLARPTINEALDWLADVKGVRMNICAYTTIKNGYYWQIDYDNGSTYAIKHPTIKEANAQLLQTIYQNRKHLGIELPTYKVKINSVIYYTHDVVELEGGKEDGEWWSIEEYRKFLDNNGKLKKGYEGCIIKRKVTQKEAKQYHLDKEPEIWYNL
jgi:hypothetical protein